MKATSPKEEPMKKFDKMKTKDFKSMKPMKYSKSSKESQKKALSKVAKKPVYKSGMKNGQPVDLMKQKRGIITSID